MRFSTILAPLALLLTSTIALPGMVIDLEPANPEGGKVGTLEIPTRDVSTAEAGIVARGGISEEQGLDKRACPSNKKLAYQGGGCSLVWAGHCFDRCAAKSKGKGCCSGTVSSSIVGHGCVWGYSTCECTCMKG